MSEQEPKGFKVVDKRGLSDEERGIGANPAPEAAPPPTERGTAPGKRAARGGPPTFLDLVGTLQFGALASLGMVQAPDGKRTPVNLETAKESIDMLGVLQEKTRGNLTGEETEVLNEGLYHIRMAYVAAIEAAAGQGGKKK